MFCAENYSDASIVTTTLPIVTMIVAAIYLKEPVTNKKVLGIFVGANLWADLPEAVLP